VSAAPVDIPPFTTVVWRSRKAREEYEAAIEDYDRVYHKVELVLIKEGYRKCDVEHVYPETLQDQMVMMAMLGFKFRVLDFVRRYSGFAHKHERPTGAQDTMIFGVVAEDERYLEEYARAYHSGDHDAQGRLLGYPECCRRFFSEVWSRGEYDPILEIARRTGVGEDGMVRGDPLLNVMLRYVGVRVIPFLPCSFRCRRAREFALAALELLKREDRGALLRALELLSMPVRWSQVNGITQVEVGDVMVIVAGGYTAERQEVRFIPEYDPTGLV